MFLDVKKSMADALEACRTIQGFTSGHSLDTYCANHLLRSAVERQFEILGEALGRMRRADHEFNDRLPEIGAIIGMRNRIILGYDSVDDAIVWDASQTHLPKLIQFLEQTVKP